MSAQFGRWNFGGKALDPDYQRKVRSVLPPYGPDGSGSFVKDGVSILYYALHITKESRREVQPHLSEAGAVITWDGRLDNREELIREFSEVLTKASTDIEVVAAVYDRRGADGFARLIGDWALAAWSPRTRSLKLARDFAGTRLLYYSIDRDGISWSSVLDPLVILAGESLALNEEYVAGWLAYGPAAHLTPYVGIHAVPPSSFLSLRPGKQSIRKYWDFDAGVRVHYRTDDEYEEHFRAVFEESVRRRLRSDRPVLAELSGGIDSSSIVCVADAVIARGNAETPRLDTVSYYDDAEPNWNERPFFTKVEEHRGRSGCHINVGSQEIANFESVSERIPYTPSASRQISRANQHFIACLKSQRNLVVISGTGGDEVTGGLPTGIPELQDLLARLLLIRLARALKGWALSQRKPWWQMLFDTIREFAPFPVNGVFKPAGAEPWLDPRFVLRHRAALAGYVSRLRLLGALPTFQKNLTTLDALRRQLACEPPAAEPAYEKCYPYLDRSLLEFLYAIPRDQLVRPGQRRSLMRRALAGIVPSEVLNRRRKAFVVRSALQVIAAEWKRLIEISCSLESSSLGIVTTEVLSQAVQNARYGDQVPIVSLMRTLSIESWLREIKGRPFRAIRGFDSSDSLPAQDQLKPFSVTPVG